MSIDDTQIKQVQGRAYFAKLKTPVPNYNKDGTEWSIEVGLDKDTVKLLKSLGLGKKIKPGNEKHDGLDYISFRRASVKKAGPKAGQSNEPIRIVGPDAKPWDSNVLIGNGSVVNVKFAVHEVVGGPKKERFVRADILSLQIWEHVPYTPPARDDEFEQNQDAPAKVAVGGEW